MVHSIRRSLSRFLRLAAVIAIGALLTGAGFALPAATQGAATLQDGAPGAVPLRDGVLVDAGRGVAYVMSPQGGVSALSLAGGKVLWHAADAVRPLAAAGAQLIAQGAPGAGGELTLLTLDAGSGALQRTTSRALPDGVKSQVADSPNTSFHLRAALVGGEVMIAWSATQTPLQAVLPSPQEGAVPALGGTAQARVAPGPTRSQGALLLDPSTGTARPAPAKSAVTMGPRLDTLAGSARIAGLAGRQLLSADGHHVLVSGRNPDGGAWHGYRWQVYGRDGAAVGSADLAVSSSPFVVHGSTLIYVAQRGLARSGREWIERPLSLRAVDLVSGQPMWDASVQDPSFQGPFVP